MNNRLKLQSELEKLLGNRHVYYQPPESLKIEYPAIVYSKDDINSRYADNTGYRFLTRYTITVIDKKPDNTVIDKLLCIPYCSFDRHYISDNLNHDILTLYY